MLSWFYCGGLVILHNGLSKKYDQNKQSYMNTLQIVLNLSGLCLYNLKRKLNDKHFWIMKQLQTMTKACIDFSLLHIKIQLVQFYGLSLYWCLTRAAPSGAPFFKCEMNSLVSSD